MPDPTAGPTVVEGGPTQCPAGHRMGPPVGGVVLTTVGSEPCRCPAARYGSHRTWRCQKPGCPDPAWREGDLGPCTSTRRSVTPMRTYAPGERWHRELAPAQSGETTAP